MKRVIGILGVVVISMLLGFSVGWAQSEDVTLVSDTPSTLISGEV